MDGSIRRALGDLGPNGSGKTTLLKLACGYLSPNAGGIIRRKGKQLSYLPDLRKSIGWVSAPLVGVYVTHHVEEILPLFTSTLVLRGGKVLYAGPTRCVLRGDVLKELYRVSLTVIKRRGRHWPVIK